MPKTDKNIRGINNPWRKCKAILIFCIVVAIFSSCIFLWHFGAKDNKLKMGFAKENVSPVIDGTILPVPLGGYAGLRLAETIESDLYASCTAFVDSAGNSALIYSIDSIGLATYIAEEIVGKISEQTGVSKQSIIVNCTHNHASPELDSETRESYTYRTFLTDKLIAVAKNALADASPLQKVYAGYIHIPDFSYIRRDAADVTVDPYVPVAKFERADKKDVLLINWAAHCDTVASSNKTAVSSDYTGVVVNTLEQEHGISVSLQMGACGDVNPACFSKHTYIGRKAYGKALADTIFSQLQSLQTVDMPDTVSGMQRTVGVKVDRRDIELQPQATEIRLLYYADKMDEYRAKCKEYGITDVYEATAIVLRAKSDALREIRVRAVRAGGLAFAAAPYEMFACNGESIKKNSPFDVTFVMGYSNGKEGYIASADAFAVKGYEVYSCLFEQGTAELLAGTLSSMINELSDLPSVCRHEFETVESDEDFHLLQCKKCTFTFANPTKHDFDENGICITCKKHIHKNVTRKGFSGLTMACIGDSITMGAHIQRSYADVVKELLGLEAVYNYGGSWSTVGHKENCDCNHPYLPDDYNHDPVVYRCTEMEEADIIFILGGLNDFGMELPLGTIEDATPHTFYGALNLTADKIKQAYPNAYVFMGTNFYYFDGYTNENGETWERYNQAIRDVCQRKEIDCLDLYNLPFNRLTDTVDYVHPNQQYTTEVLAPAIAQWIRERYDRTHYFTGCIRCGELEKVAYENLFTDTIENHGKVCSYDLQTNKFKETPSEWYSYTLINVEDIRDLRFAFTKERPSQAWSYFFYDENDVCIGGANMPTGLVDVYVQVPQNAKYVGVLYHPNATYGVYQAG